MEQEKFDMLLIDYLSGNLDENQMQQFENHLQMHPEDKEAFEALASTWNDIDHQIIPEPSSKMDASFFDMLHAEIDKKEQKKSNWVEHIATFFDKFQKPQLALGLVILAMGLGIGYYLKPNVGETVIPEKIVSTSNEAEEVREQLVLTLLEQPSANKRLQGVGEANKIQKVDDKVIKALLQTLNQDPNVNVRLAAIESLTNYLDNPVVRAGLVQSIVKQESPIVQVTLANLMVALQEKESIAPFKTLMRTKELDQAVKKKLETSIGAIKI